MPQEILRKAVDADGDEVVLLKDINEHGVEKLLMKITINLNKEYLCESKSALYLLSKGHFEVTHTADLIEPFSKYGQSKLNANEVFNIIQNFSMYYLPQQEKRKIVSEIMISDLQ